MSEIHTSLCLRRLLYIKHWGLGITNHILMSNLNLDFDVVVQLMANSIEVLTLESSTYACA